MKYSVIIPAYNAEKTLRRCLDSIVCQLPADVELLLINDGSDDGTDKLCDEYASRYPNIRLFSKSNGGVSSARNIGLENAVGDYILFIDADDAVCTGYFSVLDEALRDSPDMLLFKKQPIDRKIQCVDDCGSIMRCSDAQHSSRFLSKYMRRQALNLITTKAFRRELIEEHHLRFDERLDIGEDKVFAFAFAIFSKRIDSITAPLYCLSEDDPSSLSRKKRDTLCESILLEHRLMDNILKNSDISNDCKKYYQNALNYSFYRSAYTAVGELQKYDLSGKERRIKAKDILTAFSRETEFRAKELSCRCIAFPVNKRKAAFVDFVMRCSPKRGCP